jgi:hypothetical protein
MKYSGKAIRILLSYLQQICRFFIFMNYSFKTKQIFKLDGRGAAGTMAP